MTPPKAGHRRGIGVIYVLSGALFLVQMGLYLASLYGWLGDRGLSPAQSQSMFRAHTAFFLLGLTAYLVPGWRRREVTLQDAFDAGAGFVLYALSFGCVALALNLFRANWLFSLVPGLLLLAYGTSLLEDKPIVDLSKTGPDSGA